MYAEAVVLRPDAYTVSMKSGLEGRNNPRSRLLWPTTSPRGLNEVRPRRPEQFEQARTVAAEWLESQ